MNNTPPNLDELWRDFTRRLDRLFGRKRFHRGGLRPGRFGRGADWRRYTIGALIVLLAIWFGSGIYIVPQGQASVVLQFGRYQKTAMAGMQWRLPYPFQSNEMVNLSKVYSVKVGGNRVNRLANAQDSLVFTKSGDIIDLGFTVHYHVNNASDFLFNHVAPHANVMQAAEIAARAIVSQYTLEDMQDMLNGEHEQLAVELAQAIQSMLSSTHTGLYITNVSLQSIAPPEPVKAAFDEVNQASEERERRKREAQAAAHEAIAETHHRVQRIMAEAEDYKIHVVTQARGDALRFEQMLAEYMKAPTITREHMYWSAMQQVYKNSTKILVESNKSVNNLILLSPEKLLEQMKYALPPRNVETNATEPATPRSLTPSSVEQNNDAQNLARPTARSTPQTLKTRSNEAKPRSNNDDALRARDFFRNREHSQVR